eukprot:13352265-Alexandrium_andersonii.AAC.1
MVVVVAVRFIFDLSPPGVGVVPSVVGRMICDSSCVRLHQDLGMERVRTGLEGIDHPGDANALASLSI